LRRRDKPTRGGGTESGNTRKKKNPRGGPIAFQGEVHGRCGQGKKVDYFDLRRGLRMGVVNGGEKKNEAQQGFLPAGRSRAAAPRAASWADRR